MPAQELGQNVAIVYGHNDANARTTAGMVADLGRESLVFKADVRDAGAIGHVVEGVVGKWRHVHCLVNNAGIFRHGSVLELSEDDWDEVVSVDLKGPFVCTQAVARHMVAAKQGGKIINIGSVDGRGTATGISCYASAKAGLIQLTRASALELAPLDAPKVVVEREVPLGRMGEAKEAANLVLFLASDESNYITGTEMVIDGGLLLRPYTV